MYYTIGRKYDQPLLCIYGWTDNLYIAQSYMRDRSETDDVIMYEYDCDYREFLDLLDDYYDIDITEINRFKIRIATTKSGRNVLITRDEFELILTDTAIVSEMIETICKAFMTIDILSKYIKDEKTLIFLEFFREKYFYDAVKILYNEGDCYNSQFDVLYLLLTEGYLTEI